LFTVALRVKRAASSALGATVRSLPFILVLGSALALSACVGLPSVDTRLPATFERQAISPTPDDSGDLDRWWFRFEDPLLNDLVAQALERNTDARTAAARLEEARATRAGALTNFLPQGDPAVSAVRARTAPSNEAALVSKSYSADFDVSWQLDFFGRFGAARSTAKADMAAERFAYEGARANVAATVADAYFQARGLAIQLADARESRRVQQDLYDLTSRKAERGFVSAGDADRVAGDLSQSVARVAGLEADLQVQKRALLILVGRVVDPTNSLDIAPSVGQAPNPPASFPAQLLARRPDIREAHARLVSATGQANLARLAFLPTMSLTPGLGWSRVDSREARTRTDAWSIGALVSQPVLDIPRLAAQLGASKARVSQAAVAYEASVQTAFRESEAALVRLEADRSQVAALTEGERRAQRAYRLARNNYARGVSDLQTALSAEQAWRTTRSQLTSAQVQALRRAVQAFQALGGGWPSQTDPTMAHAQ
jgi:multidrug efflux system outer membrane protein